MSVDLGRVSRSSRNKNAKYRDLSDSDSESCQSDYENGEEMKDDNPMSDSGSDSEEKTIHDVISAPILRTLIHIIWGAVSKKTLMGLILREL